MPHGTRTGSIWRGAVIGALLGLAAVSTVAAQEVVCEKCHGNQDFLVDRRGRGPDSSLYVPATTLADTRHASLRCADCHQDYDAGYPHAAQAKVVPCQTCHEAAGRDWAASIHAPNAVTNGDAPTCTGCHGSHTVYGADDRRSPTHPLNVAATCGRCHADPGIIGTYFATADKAQARTAVAQFYKTVHGGALTRDGLVVSATCNDCHGEHLVLPADSSASTVNRRHIPATCGACHVGITEVYDRSAHGVAYARDDTTDSGNAAPVCVDCHSAHEIVRADQPQWFLGVVQECGTCHEHLYETYFDTYHGRVTHLGSTLAATCSDCHTPHDMRPMTDPESSVYPANLVTTCARCHPAANANFARYRPHGDHRDRANYPALFWTWWAMTGLLTVVLVFFAIHTLLWLTRLAVDAARGGDAGGGHGETPAGSGTRS